VAQSHKEQTILNYTVLGGVALYPGNETKKKLLLAESD
jgi:hypothetical protein